MIELIGYDAGTGRGWSLQLGQYPKYYWVAVIERQDLKRFPYSIRPSGEYLLDIGYFDKFRNNQCRNFQWKGKLCRPEWQVSPTSLIDFTRYRVLSAPPMAKVGSQYAYIVNDVPYTYEAFDESYGRWELRSFEGLSYAFGSRPNRTWHYNIVQTMVSLRSKGSGTDRRFRAYYEVRGQWWNEPVYSDYGAWYLTESEAVAAAEANWTHARDNGIARLVAYYRKHPGSGFGRHSMQVKTYSWNTTGSFSTEDVQALGPKLKELLPLQTTNIWTEFELSRHARDLVEKVNDYDSNLIAYASDLSKTGDTVRSLLHLAADYDNPKAWASAWLSLRYGDRLQIADTAELFNSLKRALTERQYYTKVRDRIERNFSSTSYHEAHSRTSTIYVAPSSKDGLTTSIENLMRWDAWPTLENTWDMIPLSFLVDWIVPVSDLLGQIDAAVESPYLTPISSYIGERHEAMANLCSPNLTGIVRCSLFKREPYNVLADVRPFDWDVQPPSFSVVHLGDALALAMQFA